MTGVTDSGLVLNGWRIYAHALFLSQVEELQRRVRKLQAKDPQGYRRRNATKQLAATLKIAFQVIPQDPTKSEYRQGKTLGDHNKHWFRAKFLQQYRLFFRFSTKHRVIVLVWVNDETTKRAYDSSKDAYTVFKRMLNAGNPPSSWNELLEQAQRSAARLTAVTDDSAG